MKEWIPTEVPIQPIIVASIFFCIPSFPANQKSETSDDLQVQGLEVLEVGHARSGI